MDWAAKPLRPSGSDGRRGFCGSRRREAAEGSRPLPTMQKAKGWHSKAAGRACPAPTDCCENLRTRGAREGGSPPPFPLTGCRGRLRAAYMPPLQSCRLPLRGFGGAWRRTTSAASLLRKPARAVVCPAGAIIVRSPVSLRSTVAPRAQSRTASKQRQFSLVLSFAAKRKNKFPGDCRSRFTRPVLHKFYTTFTFPWWCTCGAYIIIEGGIV